MRLTRRELGKMSLAVVPCLAKAGSLVEAAALQGKPNSNVAGVQLGLIVPYALAGMPGDAESVLKAVVQLGISGVEMQNAAAEGFAGAPSQGRGGGRGRGALTPEQQEAARQAVEALKQWRLSVGMDKFKALRKLYNDAGVNIYAYKFEYSLANLSGDEVDYGFNVATTLGATHVTMELQNDPGLLKRAGDAALRYKIKVGYHFHKGARFNTWDQALSLSKGNAINIDIGHYVGGSGLSPIPFFQKYHRDIVSFHWRDETKPSADGTPGKYVPWGEGDVPIKELFQLMKRERYPFPATIEYVRLEGHDTMTEIAKGLQYAKDALA